MLRIAGTHMLKNNVVTLKTLSDDVAKFPTDLLPCYCSEDLKNNVKRLKLLVKILRILTRENPKYRSSIED